MRVCAWLTVAVVLWGPLSALKGGETPALPEQVNEGSPPGAKSAAEWKRQLRAWLKVLREAHRTGDDSADDLKERIRKIRDPNALPGLQAVVSEGRDYPRLYFLEPLAKIGGRRAIKTLVEVCATDTNISVRKAAAKWIGQMPNRQEAVPEFVKFLRAPRYSGAAAEGLSTSGLAQQVSTTEAADPALTNALINALVVKRIRLVPIKSWSYVPRAARGPGYHYHEDLKYFRVEYPVRQREVLKTLVEYAGDDYGYDQHAWRKWYQSRKSAFRRDD
jgi:hypothetical protein